MNTNLKQFSSDMPVPSTSREDDKNHSRVAIKIRYADGYTIGGGIGGTFYETLQTELERTLKGCQYLDTREILQKVLDTKDEDLYNMFIEDIDDIENAFEYLAFVEEETWAKENGLE